MEFSSFFSNLVESFQFLAFANDLNSTIFVQFAVNKLHHTERLQWTQYLVNNDLQHSSLALFNDWLRNLALACDYLPQKDVSNISNTSRNHRNSIEPNRRNDDRQSNQNDNQPSTNNQGFQKKSRNVCAVFNQKHHSSYCDKYKHLSVETKRKLVLWKSLCLTCLGQHMVEDCPSKRPCATDNITAAFTTKNLQPTAHLTRHLPRHHRRITP